MIVVYYGDINLNYNILILDIRKKRYTPPTFEPILVPQMAEEDVTRDAIVYRQNQQYRQTQEIDRWRQKLSSSAANQSNVEEDMTTKEERESLLHSDSDMAEESVPSHATTEPPNRILRWALSSATESFFSDSVAISMLLLGTTVILLHVRLTSSASGVTPPNQQIPWVVIASPIFLSAFFCVLGSIHILIRECGKSSLLRRRLPKSTIVDHINHICFWLAAAASAGIWTVSMTRSSATSYPALFIVMPIIIAMLVQGSLYCAKNRHYACGFQVPEGFPVDPIHLTTLFVAARIDQFIMWDWGLVLWCPWCVWILALYNTIVYAIITGDILMVNRREGNLPIQEQSYAMLVGANRYVQPRWLGFRNGARFMMSLATTVGMFLVLHYGALRLNGNVEIALGLITVPMATMLIICGISMLFVSCIVNTRIIQNEPHKCSYCGEPISMMLQIDHRTYQRATVESSSMIESADMTVGVLRYENPDDSLQSDIDINTINDITNDNTILPDIPVQLIRRSDQAMWSPYRRKKDGDGGGGGNIGEGETKFSSRGSGALGGAFGRDASNSNKCTICREKLADCVFLNCGHNTQCWDCARRVIHAQNRHRFNRNAITIDGGGGMGGDAI